MFQNIARYIKKSDKTLVSVAEYLSMSDRGLRESIKSEKLTVANLNKIAEFYKVPVSTFFDKAEYYGHEDKNMAMDPQADYGLKKENEQLRKKIEILQMELVSAKDEIINLLKNK